MSQVKSTKPVAPKVAPKQAPASAPVKQTPVKAPVAKSVAPAVEKSAETKSLETKPKQTTKPPAPEVAETKVVIEEPKIPDSKSSGDAEEEKRRNPRKKVTQVTYREKMQETIAILEERIETDKKNQQKVPRELRKVLKNLKSLEKDAPKLSSRRHQNQVVSGEAPKQTKTSGLMIKCPISEELREFLGLEEAQASRNDATNALCAYIRLKDNETRPDMLKWKHLNPGGKRDLQDPSEKMKIIFDDKLSKLLKYDQYKKDVAAGKITRKQKVKGEDGKKVVIVSDTSIRYCDLQRLIKPHFLA